MSKYVYEVYHEEGVFTFIDFESVEPINIGDEIYIEFYGISKYNTGEAQFKVIRKIFIKDTIELFVK